jgi:hypothetical protein
MASWAARTGLPQEGVAALQESGLWRYGAALTAHTLKGDERAAALDRWAAHVHQVPRQHSLLPLRCFTQPLLL